MRQLHDIKVDDFLDACVRITPEALEEEFVRLPADLAYWGAKFSDATRAFLMAKLDVDRLQARLTIEHRLRLASSVGKVTESMVESAVEDDQEYANVRIKLIDCEVEKVRLYGLLDAIRTKRDMLISVGAHVRAEMQGDPQLRDEARGRRLARESR